MKQLKILITGAAGGLGSAIADQLARKGVNLLLMDKNSRALDVISDRIRAAGLENPGLCTLDLANSGRDEFQSLVDILRGEYAGLDVIIHCAATFEGLQSMDQIDAVQWLECMQVNVNAAWLLTKSCLALLKSSGRGRVVFIQEDERVFTSAYYGVYGVSKAALRSLGSILEEELEGTGVQVLNVYPGPMRTELRARAYLAENPNSLQEPTQAAKGIIDLLMDTYSD